MKMPDSRYAKTGDVKDHNTFDMDALKQYGRDLLEAAAVECENYPEWANWGQTDNYVAANEGAQDCAAAIRKLKETL
jgi:hypothetical protein